MLHSLLSICRVFTDLNQRLKIISDRDTRFVTEHRIYVINDESGLVSRSIQLLRENKIKFVKPLKIFSASEIVRALRHFGLENRIEKVAMSFEELESELKVCAITIILCALLIIRDRSCTT